MSRWRTMLQIKMTYCHPDRVEWMCDEFGRDVLSRSPNSPTRPARAWEVETWWEDVRPMNPAFKLERLLRTGILRERPQVGSNGKAKHV